MPELIDKERAYTALKHEQYTHGLSFSAEAFEKAARIIDQMPTIEAEPVRHGRWIRRETVLDTECKCSVCGYKDFVPKHDNYWFRRKFCPNCGALMDLRSPTEVQLDEADDVMMGGAENAAD